MRLTAGVLALAIVGVARAVHGRRSPLSVSSCRRVRGPVHPPDRPIRAGCPVEFRPVSGGARWETGWSATAGGPWSGECGAVTEVVGVGADRDGMTA